MVRNEIKNNSYNFKFSGMRYLLEDFIMLLKYLSNNTLKDKNITFAVVYNSENTSLNGQQVETMDELCSTAYVNCSTTVEIDSSMTDFITDKFMGLTRGLFVYIDRMYEYNNNDYLESAEVRDNRFISHKSVIVKYISLNIVDIESYDDFKMIYDGNDHIIESVSEKEFAKHKLFNSTVINIMPKYIQ